tara:strand:- start:478 stop:654 length:177 start_codon:yes stop_codon:yes gene_type:complete
VAQAQDVTGKLNRQQNSHQETSLQAVLSLVLILDRKTSVETMKFMARIISIVTQIQSL